MVELVIAVLIVGILSAIAIPNYQKYLLENKEKTAISDIKVIELKIKAFTAENCDIPPIDLASMNLGSSLPLIDPWGNPYQYCPISGYPGNHSVWRRDHALNPINHDFDLYSMGPNGASNKPLQNTQSRDDIIRANDGAFIGRASTFDP